ncbi:MAG: hypothetical protein PHO37_07610 [Kiritimatiellae bacterium]|nr:hypothetical protein [Kiritimatiellia bacterium]
MKIQRTLSMLLMGAAVIAQLTASAVDADPKTAPITLGRWHSDLYKAEAYSKQHNIPMVFIWGSIGCSYCNKMDGYVETATFKSWMAQRQLVMVYLKQASNTSPPEMHYGHDGINGQIWEFPFVSVYWYTKNVQDFNFVGRFYSADYEVNAQTLINKIESYIGEYSSQPLQGLTIGGAEEVSDDTQVQYSATYRDANGNDQTVSESVTWSVSDLSAGTISSTGLFTPVDITGTKDVVVRATYLIGGKTYVGEKLVTVQDASVPSGKPTAASIDAPAPWLQGGTTAQLKAMLVYENGLFEALAPPNIRSWQVLSGPVTISPTGLLSANSVTADTTAMVQLRVTTPLRVTFTATLALSILVNPPAAAYTLEVSGPNFVNEGSVTKYTAWWKTDGALDQDISVLAQWSVTGPASVDNAGNLTANQVAADSLCTLTATYEGKSSSMLINILDVPVQVVLESIVVSGPASVEEGLSGSYSCIAIYSDQSTNNVTQLAQWSIPGGGPAFVQQGNLTAGAVELDTPITLKAVFGGKEHSIPVNIINKVATSIEISGPTSVNEGDVRTYTCTAYYANGQADVTAIAQWSRDHSSSSIAAGLFTAGVVTDGSNCLLRATYEGLEDTFLVTIAHVPVQSFSAESFETGFGIWSVDTLSGFEWTRHQGATPTHGTGPVSASDGEYYLYTEASDGNTNKTAAVESALFTLDGLQTPLLTFDFHMYGVGTGELHVDVYKGQWEEGVWSRIGMQHLSSDSAWTKARVDLSGFAGAGAVKVRLRGITGENHLSDIAVDNFRVIDLDVEAIESFDEWVLAGGLTSEDNGPEDMPHNDGIPNLLKYASGLDNSAHSTADYMNISNSPATGPRLYFYKDKSANGVELTPLWTYALSAYWTALPGSEFVSEKDGRELWMIAMPEGPAGFIKLRAVASESAE